MKKILGLSIILMSVSTMASHRGDYKSSDAQLATDILKTCPAEAASIFEAKGYTRATGGSFFGGLTLNGVSTVYSFHFETRTKDGSIVETTVTARELIDREGNAEVTCSID